MSWGSCSSWQAQSCSSGARLSIATHLGIVPVIIGLTVVAFGASAPELAVGMSAALGGNGDVPFGNVAGSSIGNIF
ncbi:MAG: hypothetical protein ACLGI8_00760 [Acidimicrobiia bacterium]